MTIIAISALTYACMLAGAAISSSPQAKSFDDIIAASLRAMGGEAELSKIQSIIALANCNGPRGKYTTEVQSARHDRLLFRQITAGGEVFLSYTNGAHVWLKDSKTGEVSPGDKTLAAGIRSHEFQMMAIDLPKRYKKPVFEGEEEFGGTRCYKIRMIDELGSPCHVFFDIGSQLWAGKVILDPRSDKGETVRVVMNAWKQVGKVKLPSKVTATDKSGDWVLDFYDIKLNQVEQKVFDVPPSIAAVQEMLQLHEQQRAAHLGKDANLLVSIFADDFVNVSAGKINRPTRDESLKRFRAYLERSNFLEWEDIAPPIIRVAQDASMAYVIVHKRVRLTAQNERGETEEETTIFAWMETYEKQRGKWVLTAVASTNQPPLSSR
jgi:hypothetical protein